MVEIAEAATAALPEGFLELPSIVYADDPNWVPEDMTAVSQTFRAANPWYLDGGESAAFCIPGKARLATFVGPHMQSKGRKAAYFGYWETTGDSEADDALFERARQWAVERGAHRLFGPVNFTTYGQYRIRIAAPDGGPTFANEPYNPPYYEQTLERLGFERAAEALTQITPRALAMKVKEARMAALVGAKQAGFRLEPFTHAMWLSRLPELYVIVDAMFRENWGYTPISLEVFEKACGESFIRKTCPQVSTALFAPDGELAGFFLAYPHWGPLIMQSAGEARVPVSELDYATHWNQLLEHGTPAIVPKTSAILAQYRGHGLFTAMATELVVRGEDLYDDWYGALIGADKHNRHYGEGVGDHSRWYAVYGTALQE